MRFCINCKHYRDHDICHAPKNVESPDPVDGNVERRWLSCSIQREDGFIWSILLKSCGHHARWFEPSSAAGKEGGDA